MKKTTKEANKEQALLLEQVNEIARGLGETFAPFCEVVVHDLLHPDHAILAIYNNLSGRDVGSPATELGMARVTDPEFPQIVSNYANQLPDGRQIKSTSIGIKDSRGRYIAALCLNVDLSLFRGLQNVLEQFGMIGALLNISESIQPGASTPGQVRVDPIRIQPVGGGSETICARIDQFAALHSTTPRALKSAQRRALVRELKSAGFLNIRKSMETVAQYLGVSRATVYNDAR